MHEALELGRQRHVNDDRGQPEHPPDLGVGVLEVLRVAAPGVEEARRQFAREHGLDLLDDGADGHRAGRGGNAGAAQAAVMADRVWRGALRAGDHAAELDQIALVVPDKNLVQVLRCEARLTFQLGHHVIFLAADFDAAQIEPAEENLHRARDVLDADPER